MNGSQSYGINVSGSRSMGFHPIYQAYMEMIIVLDNCNVDI